MQWSDNVFIILAIVAAVVIMIGIMAWQDTTRTRDLRRLFALREDEYKARENKLNIIKERDKALITALGAILFELLHTDSKQALRWKFHVVRHVEPLLKVFQQTENDIIYNMIMRVLNSDGETREQFMIDLRLVTRDYYMLDLEDGQPLLDLFEAVLHYSEHIEDADLNIEKTKAAVIEAAKALKANFEILDTDPLGPMPNTTDAEKLKNLGPLTREEMLERLIAIAASIPPIEEEKPEADDAVETTEESVEE